MLKEISIQFGVDHYFIYERTYDNIDDMIKFKTSDSLPTNEVDVSFTKLLIIIFLNTLKILKKIAC